MPFVNEAEHDQGFKEVEVTLRKGGKAKVILHAPSRLNLRRLNQRKAKEPDLDEVHELCQLALGSEAAMLDKVEPFSASLIEATVLEFTYGSEAMERIAKVAEEKVKGKAADPNGLTPAPQI